MTDDTTSADSSAPDASGPAGFAGVPALAYYAQSPTLSAARTFAVIGCRVVALFVLYQATVWLGYLVPALLNAGRGGLSGNPGLESLTVVAAPFLATCAVAALLWWKAGWLADRMIGRDIVPVSRDDRREFPPDAPPAPAVTDVPAATAARPGDEEGSRSLTLSVGLAAVGALVLSVGVPDLFRSLFVAMFDRENDFSAWWRSIEWQGQLWAGVLKCALGFWLLLGSRGIARLVRNLRHADATAREENEGDRAEPAGEPASRGDDGATR